MSNQKKILKEVATEEILKCASDPTYFLKKYVYIQTSRGRVLFNPYKFQDKLIHLLNKHDRVVILKSRQLGITTLSAAYALWLMIFKKDQSILTLAPTQEKAKNIVDKVRFAYAELPSWLKVPSLEDNKLSLVLKNGSKIKAASGASESARGYTANILILDEAAFIENAEDLWGSAQQTLATGGKAIVLSTPNGFDGFFHKMWDDSEMGENNFVPVKLKWDVHPDRDQKWRDDQDRELGKRMAAQECFEGSTRIYTKKGLKKIEEIEIGEEVLTHTGNYKKVVNKFSHESDNLYEIKSSTNNIVRRVTKNHPFYYKNDWVELEKIPNKTQLPSFITNNEIKKEETIVDLSELIIPEYFKLIVESDSIYVNDRKHKTKFPRYIKTNYNFGYILGLYLAEGSSSLNRVTFTFDYKKEINDWPAELAELFKIEFNINSKIRKKKGNCGDIDFCSQIFSKCIKLFISGDDCYTKHLSDFCYENMNEEFAKGIVDGAFKGDGCVLDQYKKSFSTASEDLFYDLYYLLKSMNVTGIYTGFKKGGASYNFLNRETSYKTSNAYYLSIGNSRNVKCENRNISSILYNRKPAKKSKEYGFDGYIWNTVIKNSIEDKITVYNIEVEDDHTYVTEHFVVHNCDCNFHTSGDTYFETEDLEYYSSNIIEPIEMRGPLKDYWVWEYPDPSKSYMVIVDTARGDGSDSSTVQVIETFSGNQAAEYKGNMDSKMLSKFAISVSIEYNNALLIIENTGLGHATMSDVIDLGYNNIYYSPKGDTLNVSQYMTQYYEYDTSRMTPGFTTSTKTRPEVLLAMRGYVKDHLIRVPSIRTVNEMKVFVWKNGKPQAQVGYNDDLVIPYAIALYLRDSAIQYRSQGIDMQRAVLNGMSRTSQTVSNYNAPSNFQNPYHMQVNGQIEDMSWVIK
jgi:intein/homing endonuclease